jgi:uncharacterized membrane protein (GlpM family)
MSIRAEVSIGALADTIWVVETEIFFVFLIAVVFLHKRMRIEAAVTIRAFLILLYIAAHFS